MILVEKDGHVATLRYDRWAGDPALVSLLEGVRLDRLDYYPDRERSLAELAVQELGVTIKGAGPRGLPEPDGTVF